MTSSTAFTVDAARALGGPDWLVARRVAAAERLGTLEWPSPTEEIWRYSRIDDLDPARYRPVPAEELNEPGDERAPGGGPWAAEAGVRAATIVVRDGRVVRHEIDPALEAKGLRVCDIAMCDDELVQRMLGSVASETEDTFTVMHDAFLAGGAFIYVPDGVVVEHPIVVLHWSRRRPAMHRSRTRSSCWANAPKPRCSTASDRPRPSTSRTRSPNSSSAMPRTCAISRSRNTARARGTSASSAPMSAATRRCDTSAVALGGEYARLRSEARLDRASGRERSARRLLRRQRADARLPDAPGPRRAVDEQRPAVQGRGRRRSAVGLLRPRAAPEVGAEVGCAPDQPQPRTHRRRGRGVDSEPRDRSQRRALLARVDGRPDRRRPALLPRIARHPARGGRAPDRARVLRRRVRPPPGQCPHAAVAGHGHRQARAPAGAR